jgi:hypothetical protein
MMLVKVLVCELDEKKIISRVIMVLIKFVFVLKIKETNMI